MAEILGTFEQAVLLALARPATALGKEAYGRAVLLHFARWMVVHERPYLDRPDLLEYPTETWAAQDLRKANVMRIAALHTDDPLRTQLRERGDQFAARVARGANEARRAQGVDLHTGIAVSGTRPSQRMPFRRATRHTDDVEHALRVLGEQPGPRLLPPVEVGQSQVTQAEHVLQLKDIL